MVKSVVQVFASSFISLSVLLTQIRIRTNLSSELAPTSGSGTMGTRDPNIGVGYMVARARFGAAGKQFDIFDFWTSKKRLYASWGGGANPKKKR